MPHSGFLTPYPGDNEFNRLLVIAAVGSHAGLDLFFWLPPQLIQQPPFLHGARTGDAATISRQGLETLTFLLELLSELLRFSFKSILPFFDSLRAVDGGC